MKYNYHVDGEWATEGQIFVFGSNESGIHGAGAAKAARDSYGAIQGVGFGLQGRSWAIPTKSWKIESLNLSTIGFYVKRFKRYAESSGKQFFITRIGCGLAGYKDDEIVQMFYGSPRNCNFAEQWKQYLEA